MLVGSYVGLRAIEKADLSQLLTWRNLPDYRQFFREYRELSMENQLVWFQDIVLKSSHTCMFSIVEREFGSLIGACGLCYIDWVNRNADFSIYIGENECYIDEKYAVDAARLMMHYAKE